jgi:membrane protein YdbS with pleckstrin-like domain
MRIIDDIILLLAAAARAGSAGVLSAVAKTVREVCLMTWLLVAALVLLLGAVGLMIAALFIGLTPYLRAHWAAMIAAGALLAGSGIFTAFALMVSKGR